MADRAFTTSQIVLDRTLGKHTILRWNNVAVYGQETDGTEWVTRLSLFQRSKTLAGTGPLGINYYGSVNGVTDPKSYVKNYRLGVLFRRSVYRKYLFLELEPAYNYRKNNTDEKRQFACSIALRFQIALESNLQRIQSNYTANPNGKALPGQRPPRDKVSQRVNYREAGLTPLAI